jgi:membrane protein
VAITTLRIVKRAVEQFGQDHVAAMGAALAYYTIFSIAPLLILTIRIASYFYDEEQVRSEVYSQLQEVMTEQSAKVIQEMIDRVHQAQTGSDWAPGLGIVLLLAGSLGIFLHIRNTLSMIWKLEPPRGSSLLGVLLNYGLAILMILVAGLLLLASLAVSTGLALLLERLEEWLPGDPARWQVLEFGASILFLTLVFALIYRILSGRRIPWRYVWYGSVIAALLFAVGKTLLGWYLASSSTVSVYGAAGSVVAFMIWVFYSSQILFFGAELIQARRTRREWMNQAEPVASNPEVKS